ncbi:hypothetical protein O3G_MSEX014905 [Manduca sexta]|uniref:C2H2-type domain-containing protein n=1 Tax=Manduca sexta TaxID=7130 RepID=A0A922D0K7_MANSE|nr:hypothetical protein O3G_MSEX014905 [Manduca sexta]
MVIHTIKIILCTVMNCFKINYKLQFQIDINDSLPKYICTDCLEMLKIALNFKLNCETSDKKFRKLINPIDDLNYNSYPSFKHDFHSILHNIKLKRMKIEEEIERRRQKKERIMLKKLPKVKQFKCSPCELVFPNKEKLIAHRRERQCRRPVQKQSTSHKCNTCGKEFPIVARLKNHMLVHTNTFNFFCDLCPYKCKYKYYLVMHMRTHTGEKPYKCSQCNATFVNPSNLNKHKLTHQEKQFKCLLCEKAFRTNKLLREHHEAKHMNIKHTCHFCGRDFCYKSDLRKHEIRHHNRLKRDYIGGEPTYKQVERMQKVQDTNEVMEQWRAEEIAVSNSMPIVQATYIDQPKEFLQTNHTIYFSDVSGLIQQPQMVQQQTVEITLPELALKKDEVKLYEAQQGIGYF